MSRPQTKLYVAKFGNNVGRKEIEETFGKYGDIYSCKVNDRENYATVSYKYQDQADKAISKLNGSDALGGNLLVEHTLKKSRDDDHSRYPRDSRYGNSYRDQNGYRGGPQSSSRYGGDRGRSSGDSYRRGTSGPPRTDKEKYMKEGLCFTCKGQGHISKNCPEARNGGGRDRRDSRGGRVNGFRPDRERRPYRERSRSNDRSKGKSRRDNSRSRSPHDKYADKDRKRRSRKHSRKSSSSSSHSGRSNSRKDRKRSESSSSQSSRSNSNSSRSNSASVNKQQNGDMKMNGNMNDQIKDMNVSQ
ncbi:hypothetical protein ABPG74_018248 [Tetrahymena malaccensis]